MLPVSSTDPPIRAHRIKAHRKKLLPNMQVEKKCSRKAVALGEHLPTAQSTIPSDQCPAFQPGCVGFWKTKGEGEKMEISKIEEIRIRSRSIVQGCSW